MATAMAVLVDITHQPISRKNIKDNWIKVTGINYESRWAQHHRGGGCDKWRIIDIETRILVISEGIKWQTSSLNPVFLNNIYLNQFIVNVKDDSDWQSNAPLLDRYTNNWFSFYFRITIRLSKYYNIVFCVVNTLLKSRNAVE